MVKTLLADNQKNKQAFLKNGKIDLWKIANKDGSPENISEQISQLRFSLQDYKNELKAINPDNTRLTAQISSLLDTKDANDNPWEWHDSFLKSGIVVSVIEKLYLLKHQVKLAELEVLSLVE